MNKDLILMSFVALLLFFILSSKKTFDQNDKQMISIILVAYLVYLLIHQIPNFEYYSVNYQNKEETKK